MTMIRAFIAIVLTPEVQLGLDRLSKQLKQQLKGAPVRWVQVSNIHLTLKFLGNIPVENLEVLQEVLRKEAGQYPPFEISLGGLDAFPNKRRPRVVLVKLQVPPGLGSFQRTLEDQLKGLGYPAEERAFTPHLTLGRVSRDASNAEVQQLGQMIETVRIDAVGTMEVRDVHLIRSDLYPSGPVYTNLLTAEFNFER
jgi:2'-5' RNA ligase